MKKTILVVSVMMLAVFGVVGVSAQSDLPTIADIVVNGTSSATPEFTVLLAAVQAADPAVLEALNNPESGLTVFAPTDAAFAAAFDAMGVTADDVLADQAALTDLLMYHIVPGVFNGDAFIALDGALIGTTLHEAALAVSISEGSLLINEATVITPDLLAVNGVVHVIDSVLVPPVVDVVLDPLATEEAPTDPAGTIADIVIAATSSSAPEFTTLLAAVQASDPSVIATLTTGGPFTVFAPTDAAFAAALESLGLTADQLLADTPLVTQILAYHIVPGYLSADTVGSLSALEAGARVATLLPGTAVTITGSDLGVMVDGANVVTTDVVASNGIVHVIDAVLLPPMDGGV